MVEGRNFMVYTDHKPITFATDIRHISGCNNIVANELSRIEQLSTGIDFTNFAQDQNKAPEIGKLLQSGTALLLKK